MQPQSPQRTWTRPEPVKAFAWAEYAGETIIWIHGGVHEQVKTSFGEKAAARGTVIVLTGRSQNQVFDDVMIFNAALLSQVRAMPNGTDTLARIVARGKSIAFEPASAYDEQVANYWVAMNPGRIEQLAREAASLFAEQVRAMTSPAPAGQYGAPAPVTYAPHYGHDAVPPQYSGPNVTVTGYGQPPAQTQAGTPQPSYAPPQPPPAQTPAYEPVRPDAGAYPPPAPNVPQGQPQAAAPDAPPHLPGAAYGGATGVPPATQEEAGY